jgi:hypothetical protein
MLNVNQVIVLGQNVNQVALLHIPLVLSSMAVTVNHLLNVALDTVHLTYVSLIVQ